MYRVIITEGYGSGAGYLGTPAHKYMTVSGYGFSKSVKSAIRQAGRDLATRAYSMFDGEHYFPIARQMSIYCGTKLISRKVL